MVGGKSFHYVNKYMILIWWVIFVFFRENKVLMQINQFNNVDLYIEESTLKHQNVNVLTEYNTR